MAPACASTSCGRWSMTALILGLTASSRASAAVAASFAETFFDRIRAAISLADRRQRSSIAHSVSTPACSAVQQWLSTRAHEWPARFVLEEVHGIDSIQLQLVTN